MILVFLSPAVSSSDYGCKKMGGEAYEDVEVTRVVCRPIDTFTCYWAEGKCGSVKWGWASTS